MSISEQIERQDKICAKCTGKCRGCNCIGVKHIMNRAENEKMTDEERKKYYDFMRD